MVSTLAVGNEMQKISYETDVVVDYCFALFLLPIGHCRENSLYHCLFDLMTYQEDSVLFWEEYQRENLRKRANVRLAEFRGHHNYGNKLA